MFLLLERKLLIPLSHNEICKMGDWGGGCCKACPNHYLQGCTERRGQPERRGRKRRLPYTQFLGATEGWGGGRCYPACSRKQKVFAALSGCSPPSSEGRIMNQRVLQAN